MQVAKTEFQHQVMIEAVENHMPQIIIIDEIATEFEVLAARTIAEKGVQLIGTTHGNCLENLIKNPSLADLVGGIQYVTLSDDEAKRRGTQKTILERKAYPAFEIIIEINHQNSWTIHEDVNKSVDLFLRENFGIGQIRQFYFSEKIKIKYPKTQNYLIHNSYKLNNSFLTGNKNWILMNQLTNQKSLRLQSRKLVIYPYSLSYNLLKEVLLKTGLKFVLTNEIKKASLILGLKKHLKQNFKLISVAKQKKIPIYGLNKVNIFQITKIIRELSN